jgi:hypothetical protein
MKRLPLNYSQLHMLALLPAVLVSLFSQHIFENYWTYITVNIFMWTILTAIHGYQACSLGKRQKAVCDILSYCAFLYTIFMVIITIDGSSNQLIKMTNFKMGTLSHTFRDNYFALMPYAMAFCFGLGFAKRLHDYNTAS